MHILPGRIRVRFAQLKNNQHQADALVNHLRTTKGIWDVVVNTRTGSCLVLFDQQLPAGTVLEAIKQALNHVIHSPTNIPPLGTQPKKTHLPDQSKLRQVLTGGAILTLFWGLPPGDKNLPLPISAAALITTGYPVFKSGLDYFSKHKKPNYDFMVSALSLLSTLLGKGYLGLFTMWISSLSGYLQQLTFKQASHAFSNSLIKKGNRITILKNNRLLPVLPGDVAPGDLSVFRAGDCIPLEGEVMTGQATILPGEVLKPGDQIDSGTILQEGKVLVKVHRLVEDTSLARLADILEDAVENPGVGSHLARSYAERLLPVTFFTTLLVFACTRDLQRAISVLLAGAPGPAGLAAPTALSASTGFAAAMGIAVKEADALALLSNIDVVVFNDHHFLQQERNSHPALLRLAEEGYQIEEFGDNTASGAQSPEQMVAELHNKGLRVAWVSGPEHPLLAETADVNIMFLTGREKGLGNAQILCYKHDPRQVYRLMGLSHNTMHTIRKNVYLVQGMNLLGQTLGALGIIGSLPAVGLTLLTTLAVVLNSGHRLIGIGNNNFKPFATKGTFQGLSVDKGKCLFATKGSLKNEFQPKEQGLT